MKECLRKRGLDIRQAKRIEQDRSECLGFVMGNAWDVARGMPQVYETVEGKFRL